MYTLFGTDTERISGTFLSSEHHQNRKMDKNRRPARSRALQSGPRYVTRLPRAANLPPPTHTHTHTHTHPHTLRSGGHVSSDETARLQRPEPLPIWFVSSIGRSVSPGNPQWRPRIENLQINSLFRHRQTLLLAVEWLFSWCGCAAEIWFVSSVGSVTSARGKGAARGSTWEVRPAPAPPVDPTRPPCPRPWFCAAAAAAAASARWAAAVGRLTTHRPRGRDPCKT